MEKALGALSTEEFEELVERTIDRRLEVWLTQLMDAFIGWQEEGTELRPEFAASLRHSLELDDERNCTPRTESRVAIGGRCE